MLNNPYMYNKVPLFFFWFDLSLEARAQILEIILWVFWEKQSFPSISKDVLNIFLILFDTPASFYLSH